MIKMFVYVCVYAKLLINTEKYLLCKNRKNTEEDKDCNRENWNKKKGKRRVNRQAVYRL